MKILKLALPIVMVGLVMCGCPSANRPDLVVTSLTATGSPTTLATGVIQVPIEVVVKNQGNSNAAVFKTSTQYTGVAGLTPGTYVVAFTVPGQSDTWYPWTSVPLAPGDEVTFTGTVSFIAGSGGQTVTLTALADSCSGDEFMPSYCRVLESDETNNESATISIALP